MNRIFSLNLKQVVTSRIFAVLLALIMTTIFGQEVGAASLFIGLNTDDGGGDTLLGGDGDGGGDGSGGDDGDKSGDGDTPWTDGFDDDLKSFFGESKSLEEFKASLPKAAEVPETYTVPEGMEVDKDQLDAFLPIAKEAGFTQAQMETLLKYDAERMEGMPGLIMEASQAEMATGLADLNKSLGDDGFQTMVADAKTYIKALPPELNAEVKQFFDETGMGNHPVLLKVFAAHAKLFKEDAFSGGDGGGSSQKTAAQKLYPDQGKS